MGFVSTDISKNHFRWRLQSGKLPLYERHMRSLGSFGILTPLESWIRTRLEWTLDNMVAENPDGVLCIDVQDDEMVTITVVGARPEPRLTFAGELVGPDGVYTDDALGQCWSYDGVRVVHYGPVLTATNRLARDLAKTLGYTVEEAAVDDVPVGDDGDEERFRVSDEFYVIPQGEAGVFTRRLSACFDKLLIVTKES
jgi:hypothetical protein